MWYAQRQEDEKIRALLGPRDPVFYIDVGAFHPNIESVTRHFYERGGNGINIEPVRFLHEQLVERRPRDVNILGALGEKNEKRIFRTVIQGNQITGLSTLHEENMQKAIQGREYTEEFISVWTLEWICKNFVPLDKQIDFLKIDVEGFELEVIKGGNWDQYRPKVLCIESTIPNTEIRCDQVWDDLLVNKYKYKLIEKDNLNNYYVRQEGIT